MPVVTQKPMRMRARSIAHRFGPACALTATEQAVLGVRYDEEDDSAAETFVVRLAPGTAIATDQLAGVAKAVAATNSGAVFVLDERGVVHVGGRRHKLATPRAMVGFGDVVVLAADDRLWKFSADGAQVKEGPAVRARHLAASRRGIVAAADDGRVVFLDDKGVHDVDVGAGGHMAALAIDDDGELAAASGRSILGGSVDSGLKVLTSAPFEVHCVAVHNGRVLLSSRAHGLFYIQTEEGPPRVMPLKPSLRAHTLSVKDGQLVAASDLFIVTSDGADFLTRDLGPFVRLAEQRLPRFLQSEDPVSV